MNHSFNLFAFQIYPYVALAVLFVVFCLAAFILVGTGTTTA